MLENIIIQEHFPIEKASKTLTLTGELISDLEDKKGAVSQWATAVALSKFKVGQRVTIEEFSAELHKAMILQMTDELVQKGLIEEMYDSDLNDSVFHITDKGREHLEKIEGFLK